MTNQDQQTTTIEELREMMEQFIGQYELDMRGDKKINGGSIGVIGNIRKIKETQDKYPSLTWLLANRLLPTIAIGLGVWLFIWGLTVVGMIRFAAAMFGLDVPTG